MPDSTASCNWMDCSMAMSAPIFTSARRSQVWMMTSMLSRCSLVLAKSGRLPSSASIRRSSGWKITSAPTAMNTDALPSIQRSTFKSSIVVTSASASSTTTKPMTTGQPRVPRTNLKTK